MNQMPTLTHATERDVDLLLVEELATSHAFAIWFVRRAGIEISELDLASVFHSTRRMHNRREIDISFEAATDAGPILLLVENKLDTAEQPRQAESYQEEARLRSTSYAAVRSVLVSPEGYMQARHKFASSFDANISYEAIARYLEARSAELEGEISARCAYRARLLVQAVDKGRRGYVQVIHPAKRAFSRRYVALLEESRSLLVPGPSMLKDSGAESVTMIFAPETLPRWPFLPQMRIVHQLREANANINFYGWGDHFAQLAQEMAPVLRGTNYRLVPTGNKRRNGRSGLMVVAETPRIDQFGDFDEQTDAIRAGIAATEGLRAWLIAHKSEVESWSQVLKDPAG